jgi:hypothetical protein
VGGAAAPARKGGRSPAEVGTMVRGEGEVVAGPNLIFLTITKLLFV